MITLINTITRQLMYV